MNNRILSEHAVILCLTFFISITFFSTYLLRTISYIHFVSGLARTLTTNRKCVSVYFLTCNLCQKSLSYRKELENVQSVVVWGCGHCFHFDCFKAAETNDTCPQCRTKGALISAIKKTAETNNIINSATGLRPDLEGHF